MSDGAALTELQVAILRVLWARGEATTLEVHEALKPARGLAPTTVATLLSRLEKRGVLTHRREGRQHIYRALVTEKQVRRSKVRELTETLFGGDPVELVSHLVGTERPTSDELTRIREMIEAAAGEEDESG